MNTPGISLFKGAESLKINTSLERQEEEEDLEDQRRRQAELGNLLQNAFDDLDDDEGTIDSTTNFQSDLATDDHQQLEVALPSHPYGNNVFNKPQQPFAAQPADHSSCEAEIHNLKMALESRSRELEHSQGLLKEEYKARNELEKKLSITEAELDRALSNRNSTHELLVEAKEKCSNLESMIDKLKTEKKQIEAENNSLIGKLDTAQMLLADVQRKYDMVERDLNKNTERNFEMKRKHMEDMHRAEMEILQQQIQQTANKLDKKSSELEVMNTRYQTLQQNHEMMLCDKASKINDLSHALDQAQKRCEELMSRPDYFQENVRLQKLVASLQEQIKGMEKNIASLTERLEMTTAELDVMDSVLHQHNMEDTPRRLSQTHGRVVGSTPLNPIDRVGNLKDELYRALANVKAKREEVKRLQQTVEDKQNEIRILKQEENKSLVQITTLKEENIRLENKLKLLEEEYEHLKSNKDPNSTQQDNQLQTLKQELEELHSQHKQLKMQCATLEQEKQSQEMERKKLDFQIKNLEIDLEELKQEHESLKMNYEHVCKENMDLKQRNTTDNLRLELEKHKFLLKDAQAECDRLKNLYVEISNAKEAMSYEMDKLLKSDQAKELQMAKEKIAHLQRSLQLAEVKTSELSKMLETEKLCHEREVGTLREKLEKEKVEASKASKEAANECAKCMDYVAELTKFEIQNLKLTNINAVCKKEIDDLKKELKTSNDHIAELNDQLKISEHQEQLIKELKTKAAQFEEYIKSQSSTADNSHSSSVRSSKQMSDKSVVTSPELERNETKKIEARIRDEMAKIFAVELKKIQLKMHQTQEQSLCLQREYQHVTAELQQRQNEVDQLKAAILLDREKMEEILKQKDEENHEMLQKMNLIVQKSREELQMKIAKIKDLTHELNERQQQIEAERQSMKAVMKQWEEQRKSLDTVEMEWKQKFLDLQKAHELSITSWQTKYNSAKRTAANYKRYSEDKEAHMLKEYDRLKFEYDASLAKIEARLKEAYEKKNKELMNALNDKNANGKNNHNNNNKENTASNS
ncbi:repetitive organellar protein [Musca vetustissima]|uniref:repetitive organellar protein n=1 Tax=Musca vetustissima TaxID=27455 RepID=UPI002AB709B0|nr:repetitive organellar protein [Musca vetustissima]